MDLENIKRLGRLMGTEEDKLNTMVANFKIGTDIARESEHLDIDLISGDTKENHKKMIEVFGKALWTFENSDEVEIDVNLINNNMLETMWKNLNIYSYDIDNFFLDKFTFYLYKGKDLFYKMYFSIEEGSIFLVVKNQDDDITVCGTIIIKEGKFIPGGAVNELYLNSFIKNHIDEGLSTERQFISNRAIMNSLLYIIITNQMVTQNREVITETSRRVEITNKNKSKKKKRKQHKKTKQIRYIKIDGEKVRRIKEEHERIERESFERHTPEWTRRGHYKKVRSGEVKWIEPTTCYAKDKVGEKIQKLYRIK